MEFIGFHVGLWIEISLSPNRVTVLRSLIGHSPFTKSLSIPEYLWIPVKCASNCWGGGRREEGRRMVSVIICKGVEVSLCNFAQMSILLAL